MLVATSILALFAVWSRIEVANANVIDPIVLASTYSDDVARNRFLPLASAAYASNPQACLTNKYTNAQVRRQINVVCDPIKNDICSAYTAALNGDQAIVLSFRGTQGFLQLVEEADKSVFASQTAWIAGGSVSKYFADAFNTIWAGGMRDDVNALIQKYPNYEIWVTGHSLGGSMASLAASYLVASKIKTADKVKLVTYGQPRTGNKDWAVAHDNQLPYSFRVTHNRDIVPHIPNEDFEGYYQHKTEVWYKESMSNGAKFVVCSNDEDSKCSDGDFITTSVADHLHYFEKDVSSWGEAGCN